MARRKELYPRNPQGWREGLEFDAARERRKELAILIIWGGLVLVAGLLATVAYLFARQGV